MKFGHFSFGSVEIEDATYEHDVIIDRGEVLKRKKKPWGAFRTSLGTCRVSGRAHNLEAQGS